MGWRRFLGDYYDSISFFLSGMNFEPPRPPPKRPPPLLRKEVLPVPIDFRFAGGTLGPVIEIDGLFEQIAFFAAARGFFEELVARIEDDVGFSNAVLVHLADLGRIDRVVLAVGVVFVRDLIDHERFDEFADAFAAVGIAIQRMGEIIPLRRAPVRRSVRPGDAHSPCVRRVPVKGERRRRDDGYSLGAWCGRVWHSFELAADLWEQVAIASIDGRPIEIELTKMTLLPARANCFIRCFFECGW